MKFKLLFATSLLLSCTAFAQNKIDTVGNVGIGTKTPLAKLHVNGELTGPIARFSQQNQADNISYLNLENATSAPGEFIPCIKGKSNSPGRSFGLYITAEADDILTATETFGGAMVLDSRSKSGTPLTKNNLLMINSAGQNRIVVRADGSMGIGTLKTTGYKLAVNGAAIFTKVKVSSYANWPDYVFDDSYQPMHLKNLEEYIRQHKHLPEIPSAEEVHNEGIDLADMDKKLLQKIEELTLYILELNKTNEELKKSNEDLKSRVNSLEFKLNQ